MSHSRRRCVPCRRCVSRDQRCPRAVRTWLDCRCLSSRMRMAASLNAPLLPRFSSGFSWLTRKGKCSQCGEAGERWKHHQLSRRNRARYRFATSSALFSSPLRVSSPVRLVRQGKREQCGASSSPPPHSAHHELNDQNLKRFSACAMLSFAGRRLGLARSEIGLREKKIIHARIHLSSIDFRCGHLQRSALHARSSTVLASFRLLGSSLSAFRARNVFLSFNKRSYKSGFCRRVKFANIPRRRFFFRSISRCLASYRKRLITQSLGKTSKPTSREFSTALTDSPASSWVICN